MTKTTLDELYLYAELTDARKRTLQRRMKAGKLASITTGMLTSLPESEWPALVARHRIRILAALFPGAVIGWRSAFDGGQPSASGVLFLNYSYARKVSLPGLTVRLECAPLALPGDMPMRGEKLYMASLARTMLENLAVSRGTERKSVGPMEVERRLVAMCEARGEQYLNELRDQARELASLLGRERELGILDSLVGALLRTRSIPLATASGRGLAATPPYDGKRIELFEELAAYLRRRPLAQPADPAKSPRGRVHFAFLESYFSNFIEGTRFRVEDARRIVLDGAPVRERPKDSHDILSVFRQAHEPGWSRQVLEAGESVLEQLRARHADQMRERPEVNPGQFKLEANAAGNTHFVEPGLVRGTLVEGSRLLTSVPEGTARALHAMFLVSEVHPFEDGNGRLARLAMNAELSVVGACRIIVPTLWREEYLDTLRVLSREGNPQPFVDAMQRIHEWTAAFDYEDLDAVIELMRTCNAFEESLRRFRLIRPQDLVPVPAPD
ncbi:MAG: Fic family protein [Burkholderiaceae bacterium]